MAVFNRDKCGSEESLNSFYCCFGLAKYWILREGRKMIKLNGEQKEVTEKGQEGTKSSGKYQEWKKSDRHWQKELEND